MNSINRNSRGWSHHFILPVLAVFLVAAIGTYLVTTSSASSYVSGATPYTCKKDPVLKKGSSGSCVKALQYRLNIWIAYKKPAGIKKLTVDGKFGEKTYTAVLTFQKKFKLKYKDGVMHTETWKKLLNGGCGVVYSCSKG